MLSVDGCHLGQGPAHNFALGKCSGCRCRVVTERIRLDFDASMDIANFMRDFDWLIWKWMYDISRNAAKQRDKSSWASKERPRLTKEVGAATAIIVVMLVLRHGRVGILGPIHSRNASAVNARSIPTNKGPWKWSLKVTSTCRRNIHKNCVESAKNLDTTVDRFDMTDKLYLRLITNFYPSLNTGVSFSFVKLRLFYYNSTASLLLLSTFPCTNTALCTWQNPVHQRSTSIFVRNCYR